MKNLLFLLLIPFLGFSQSKTAAKPGPATANNSFKKANNGFTINGNVQGVPDGEVKIVTTQGEKAIATGEIKSGVFTLKGSVPEPGLYWLAIAKEQPRYLFIENAAITITGTKADIKKLQVEGSASHKEFMQFEQIFNPIFGKLNTTVADLNQAAEAKKPELMKVYEEALATLNTEVEKFVTNHKSSYVSLFVLSVTMQANANILQVEKYFNSLDADVKASETAKDIASYIAYAKVGAVGTEALDFTQNDVANKPVSLSSFKGKYVLVDFWASWCKPCRMENPNVVKTYNKFKAKNFTVLGVSLDQTKEAWLKAIEKDKLGWTNVSDLQFWNNAAAQLYRVQSIPQNFLIDPAGKIVAKDLRGEELEKKLCEYLGCSN